MNDLVRLLDALGRDPDEHLALCTSVNGEFKAQLRTVAQVSNGRGPQHPDRDYWYSIGALHERVNAGRGLARDVTGIRELPADLDVKPAGMPTWDAARQVVATLSDMLGVKPVAVIHSGHGLQPHWAVERSEATDWPDETDPRWNAAVALYRRWGRLVASVAERHGGQVDNIYDLSRVLRVPGTTNTKAEPVPVTVEWTGGPPVSVERIRDTLDEYGITELPGDRGELGEIVSTPTTWHFDETTCRYVTRMIEAWNTDTPNERHAWMGSQAVRLVCARRLGCISETDYHTAADRLGERVAQLRAHTGDPNQPNELANWLAWATGQVAVKTDNETRAELGGHNCSTNNNNPAQNAGHNRLPDQFWTARPQHAHIRQAAFARGRAPDAVLQVVLARIAAAVPWTLHLPAAVGTRKPLCYFTVIIGPPGAGKGDAVAIAAEILPLPPWVRDVPPGSGEGLAELLWGEIDEIDENGKTQKVRRIVHHNVFLPLDEGRMLNDLGSRKGSTLAPTLCTIWTGGALGQANADTQRYRPVPPGIYTYGLVCLFQPGTVAPLFGEVHSGLPQRFGWAQATDPTTPPPQDRPEWPGPIEWAPSPEINNGNHQLDIDPTIVDEVARIDHQRQTGTIQIDPLDGHAILYRLKVAGLLAILAGRITVNPDDWQLAHMVAAASSAVRDGIRASLAYEETMAEQRTRERLAGRAEAADAAVQRRRVVECARKIATKVWTEPDRWTRSDLRRAMRNHRDVFEDGLDHATDEGWVTEVVAPGQGTDKRTLRPGKTRPA